MAEEVKLCPVCGKTFRVDGKGSRRRVVCSMGCFSDIRSYSRQEAAKLKEAAERKKRPVREDCRMYNPEKKACKGLTCLWCQVEDCNFYKPKRR